jgi:hypothetical protein
MLALTMIELLPEGWRGDRRQAAIGLVLSVIGMIALSLFLGV